MTDAAVDRHGIAWNTYRCTGCRRLEVQRADAIAVTCHRIGEHRRPRVHRMRPLEAAR